MISTMHFKERDFLLVTGYGILDEQQLTIHMYDLIDKTSKLQNVKILIDTRGFDLSKVSSMEVFDIGVFIAPKLENVYKSVLLVSSPLIYGLSRAYIMGSNEDYKRTVLYDVEESLEWLGYNEYKEQLLSFIEKYKYTP